MNTLLRNVAAAALFLTLSAPLFAADYVKLKNGQTIRGEATAYDEATKSISFKMEDGTVRSFKLDELDGRSVYLVNHSRVAKDNAVGQLRLGNLARDNQLFAHAVRHYEYAVKADLKLRPEVDREVAVLKQKAAAWGMQQAKAALTKGNLAEAEKWLVKLVEKVPDEPEGVEAATLLEQHYTQRRAALESEATAKASEQFKKDLQPGKRAYDELVAKTQKGLTDKNAGPGATKAFESATKEGERALKELDKLDKKYTDPATRETLAGYRKMVVAQTVEAHLHLASLMTTRSSYKAALAETNKALALDSGNEQALAARARIEQAAAERGGWIW